MEFKFRMQLGLRSVPSRLLLAGTRAQVRGRPARAPRLARGAAARSAAPAAPRRAGPGLPARRGGRGGAPALRGGGRASSTDAGRGAGMPLGAHGGGNKSLSGETFLASPGGRGYGRNGRRPQIIAIDGNIGSGKSTLVRKLQEELGTRGPADKELVRCATERTEEWKEILPLYYSDVPRWSFPFQMQCLLSHLRTMKENADVELLITERSPMATQKVFGSALLKDGDITEQESALFDQFVDEFAWKPDHVIYLECPAAICDERIRKRSRDGESGIPIAYLEGIGHAYDQFLDKYQKQGHGVHRIDATKTPEATFEAAMAKLMEGVVRTPISENLLPRGPDGNAANR